MPEPIYHLAKSLVVPFMHLWFKHSAEGLENIPQEGPALIAFNHASYLDPLSIGYTVAINGRRPRFLAKSELFRDRRIAWVLRGCRQIEVKRGTPQAPMALDDAFAALDRGEAIVVFPEGTTNPHPEADLQPPKSGTARLAVRSGAPIIPGAVWGAQNVWPKGPYRRNWRPRQPIVLRFGSPLSFGHLEDSPEGWRQAGADLMKEIARLLSDIRWRVPDRRRPRAER